MSRTLKLLAVLAHPDAESFGIGSTLAKYASEGVETYLVCATRGERGRYGEAEKSPGMDIVGRAREEELHNAANILGIKEVSFLDYMDGDLDKAPHKQAIDKIAGHIRRIKSDVIITFDPEGGYGHPDHIAISQLTTAAVMIAAGQNSELSGPAHQTSKLYYMAWTKEKWDAFTKAFKLLQSKVDNEIRVASAWNDWAITTKLDTSAFWRQTWDAIRCHKTQLAIYKKLEELTEDEHKSIWGSQEFYRVMSIVNSGRKVENDLFEGLK